MLKITHKVLESISGKQRRKPIRKGYCKVCGSKLSSEKSIEIGIGQRCLANHVAIILEIIPDEPQNTACSGLAPAGASDGQIYSGASR